MESHTQTPIQPVLPKDRWRYIHDEKRIRNIFKLGKKSNYSRYQNKGDGGVLRNSLSQQATLSKGYGMLKLSHSGWVFPLRLF